MASVTVTVSGLDTTDGFGLSALARVEQIQRLIYVLRGVLNGTYPAAVDISVSSASAVRASGTLTIASGTGAVGGTIGGTAKTVTWATSDTASAAALATAINADTTLNKYVSATSAAGVVTVTAHTPGTIGNGITLTASGTGVTASAAKLASGAGPDGAPVTYSLA